MTAGSMKDQLVILSAYLRQEPLRYCNGLSGTLLIDSFFCCRVAVIVLVVICIVRGWFHMINFSSWKCSFQIVIKLSHVSPRNLGQSSLGNSLKLFLNRILCLGFILSVRYLVGRRRRSEGGVKKKNESVCKRRKRNVGEKKKKGLDGRKRRGGE